MPIKTALNGLNAAQFRLRTTAHNIANAGTDGFEARRPESAPSTSSTTGDAAPTAPKPSNVDLARQLIDMMEFSRQLEAQLKTIKTATENDDAVMRMLDDRGAAK